MSNRTLLGLGALALIALIAGATAAITITITTSGDQAKQELADDGPPICQPPDMYVPVNPGQRPTWDFCADSVALYTCWRPVHHRGRHCCYDLTTGKVIAVWPCETPESPGPLE